MSAIYTKNLLSQTADFHQQGNTFGPGASLTYQLSALNLETTLGNRIQVKVQLTEPGDYYITETLYVNCDFTIEGCENARIIVDFPENESYSDDCFIHFSNSNSSGIKTRCKTIIKNVTFGVHRNHHWRTLNELPAELHYIKIYAPQSVCIENVNMSLDGHPITNIDIRNGQNILINNCVFENYHDNITTKVGGNLWLRGIIKNVRIINNIFKKIGNDELLAFFGHYSDGICNLADYEIPDDGICRKENILVANNVFEYGAFGTAVANVSNDCLFSLIDSPLNEQQTYSHRFENILFEKNQFIINDLVLRLFNCRNEEDTIIRDVCFVNNDINYNDFMATNNETIPYLTCQIFELNNLNYDVDAKYQIVGNSVYNKSIIKNGSQPGFYFLLQNGCESLVENNKVRIFVDDNEYQQFRKMVFFWVNYMDTQISATNNNLDGLFMFGAISCPDTTGERVISCMNLLAKGNVIKGDTRIYCHNVGELNVQIENNYIISEAYVIAVQEYGSSGDFTYINNHVIIKHTGNSNFYHSTTGCDADRFIFANNVFEKVHSNIMAIILGYIDSQDVTNSNNIILN